ncbi:hypothetical protein KXV68_003332 [Aspergillus fumigatus]|nr:hypothetical protein KXX67_001549 [Aspergillus fumigatus]KAH1663694.1 hypothetical protein KXX15_009333 [Aspergillus fumigatus]KAH1725599.1 hypothetical protein KXX25_009498 [Aspergillus fumigatus]KAH1733537.1 hypothetical protein KXX40_007945 [Aspergillus fumigatus]KAH2083961.1 hypothetical protein KXW86_000856 [Aspergillus fumigatus]
MLRVYCLCWWLAVCKHVSGQVQTFTPAAETAIAYSVNVPASTAGSGSSGSGPIFIQMRSTKEVQWFAWGQGAVMQGANIFVVYANGTGITVSPRLGVEHVEPLHNPQARFSILNGSGISNGILTANIRCDSCITWPGGHEDVTSTSSPWIWAVKHGPMLDSDSVSATITIHDFSGVATVNMKQATGGSSENPFVGGLMSSSSSSASAALTINSESVRKKRIAHAVLMIVTFVLLFPLIALGIPLFPSARTVVIHASLQLCTLALVLAGFGLGISMARSLNFVGSYHPIIGIIVVASLVLFQPAMGLVQHWYFRRTGKKSLAAYAHRWLGRTAITLGMINAGLGFRLTGIGTSVAPTGAVIAYGVVAGLVWVGYVLTVSFLSYRKRHSRA